MNKAIDIYNKIDKHESRLTNKLSELIDDLSLGSITETLNLGEDLNDKTRLRGSLNLIDSVNDLSNALSQNLISASEFTELMEQVRKDKENNARLEAYLLQEKIKNRMTIDSLYLVDRVNDLSNALSQNLISASEFTELMDQVRKDKEKIEEDNAQARIKHRISDFEGMLSVFTEGSQAFLSTKVAISQLNSLLD